MMLWTFFTNGKAVKTAEPIERSEQFSQFYSVPTADQVYFIDFTCSWVSKYYLSACVFLSSLHSWAHCCAWSKPCLPRQPPGSCLAPASGLGIWLRWSVSTFWLPSQAARESGDNPRLCLQPGGVRGLAAGAKSWDLAAALGGGCAGESIRDLSTHLPSGSAPQNPGGAWLCETFDSTKWQYSRKDINSSLLATDESIMSPNMNIC